MVISCVDASVYILVVHVINLAFLVSCPPTDDCFLWCKPNGYTVYLREQKHGSEVQKTH